MTHTQRSTHLLVLALLARIGTATGGWIELETRWSNYKNRGSSSRSSEAR
jgi:hypothetical protein